MPKGVIRSSFFAPWQEAAGLTPAPAYFALRAQRLMTERGLTKEHLAGWSSRTVGTVCDNPDAMFRSAVTEEEVLASRVVCEPLHLWMLCSPNEGAAAVVLRAGSGGVQVRAASSAATCRDTCSTRGPRCAGLVDVEPGTAERCWRRGPPTRRRARSLGPRRRRVPGHRRRTRAARLRGARALPTRRVRPPHRRGRPRRWAGACRSTRAAACSPRASRWEPRRSVRSSSWSASSAASCGLAPGPRRPGGAGPHHRARRQRQRRDPQPLRGRKGEHMRERTNEVKTERDVEVSMAGGVTLLTDVYHPIGVDDAPTILERTPYGRRTVSALLGPEFAARGLPLRRPSMPGHRRLGRRPQLLRRGRRTGGARPIGSPSRPGSTATSAPTGPATWASPSGRWRRPGRPTSRRWPSPCRRPSAACRGTRGDPSRLEMVIPWDLGATQFNKPSADGRAGATCRPRPCSAASRRCRSASNHLPLGDGDPRAHGGGPRAVAGAAGPPAAWTIPFGRRSTSVRSSRAGRCRPC